MKKQKAPSRIRHWAGLLLFLFCFVIPTKTVLAQSVTVNFTNTPLVDVLKEIQKQTPFTFVYTNSLINVNKRVSVKAVKEEIVPLMNKLLAGTDITYKIVEKQITLSPKEFKNEKIESPAGQNVKQGGKIIKGVVFDETRQPLPGVSIQNLTAKTGAFSDMKGEYSLEVKTGDKLLFTSIGMTPEQVTISGTSTVLNIEMMIDNIALADIVVTGYQTISKERVTGAVKIVSLEQLQKPTTNIAQRLIGTTAGVQAKLDVDGNPTFEIRGQTSLNANKEPLVVIDGFPTEKGFTSINPNDVESVTFLKDAAAASIWGAKAANGVIVITSKKAKGNTPLKIEFNAFFKVGPKFDLNYVRPMASATEIIDYELTSFNKWGARAYNVGNLNDGYYRTYTPTQQLMWEQYVGTITAAQRDASLATYRNLDNAQQIKDNLLQNPSTQQYNLTIMGGSDKMSNFLSILHETNNSNFKNTNNSRDVISYRNIAKVTKWLDFELGATLAFSNATNNGVSLSQIQGWAPHLMLLDNNGQYTNIPNGMNYLPAMTTVPFDKFPYKFTFNPIEEINNRDITTRTIDTRINAALFIKLIEGMTFESRVQYEFNNTFSKSIYNENSYTVRSAVNAATSWVTATNTMTLNLPKGGFLDQNRSEVKALTVRNQLNYRKTLGKHDFIALAGIELSDRVAQTYTNPRTYGYNNDKLSVGTFPNGPGGAAIKVINNWLGNAQTFGYTNSFSYATRRFFASYANASYTYDSKYSLTGSIRTDASNFITNDPKYRYAPFWSVGASWNILKEGFMQNVNFVDRLTARLTFGYNGNVDNTTSFQPLISPSASVNLYTQENTTAISSLGNPTLRWEKTGTWNLGVDYSLFNGNLYGSLDLYNKYTRDLIATISIPAVNGSTSSKMNNAEMRNRGIEFEVGTTQRIHNNDIWWRGSLNFAYNHNEITKLFVAQIAASSLYGTGTYVEGYNSQEMWCFKYAGIKNEGTEAVPNWQPQVQGPGDVTYNFGGWTPGDGRTYLLNMGTKVAPFTMGISSEFKIFDFNLSFIVTGKFGHVFARQSFNYPVWWNGAVLPNQKYSEVVNGDPMKVVPLPMNTNEARFYFWDRFYPYLSYLVENASHVRLQEVNLSYDLPKNLLNRIDVNRLQLYFQANDLLTISANKFGEDPEYPIGTQNPQAKFTFGLKFDL
ncbi:MAG: SusC/RagA family TonB-linked outer membrane protein [Bacteroidales bacterium]|jgi:TonB-linked SusC/RagA family outer membrane protein